MLAADISGEITAHRVLVGRGVVVEEGAVITGKTGPADLVVLGDFCHIGPGVRVLAPEFRLGDYTKLHAGSFCHGALPLRIGRNCWFGGDTVLDSMGGLDIDDNVGVGAHSQLWTHIRFGDVVQGCRFLSERYMHVEPDVWLVGHCILSPVSVAARSMALVGSVVTSDMEPNRIYAGVPARDVTDRMGPQFDDITTDEKIARLQAILDDHLAEHPEHVGQLVATDSPGSDSGVTYFDLSDRSYNQTYSDAEVTFLKRYVPTVKFHPRGSGSFIFDEPSPSLESYAK